MNSQKKELAILKNDESLLRAAEMLGLRIVSDLENDSEPSVPETQANLDPKTHLDDATVDGNEILYHSKLFLADPLSQNPDHRRNLFFVWPESSLGSNLSSVVYSHRILNSQDQREGDLRPHRAWHDTDHHRWFIPLSAIFQDQAGNPLEDVNPSDIQELTLELTLESGALRIVRIRFQAVGPFPRAVIAVTAQPLLTNAAHFVHQSSREGYLVHSEEISNPHSREFNLWVKSFEGSSSLKLESFLKHPQYMERSNAEPTGPEWPVYRSIATTELRFLEVKHQNGKVEKIDLQEGKWSPVVLHPSETLSLKWRVMPQIQSCDCYLPVAQTVFLNWQTPAEVHLPPFHARNALEAMQLEKCRVSMENQLRAKLPPQHHTRSFKIEWEISGGILSGQWNREIRLTHPFTSEQEATVLSPLENSAVEFLTLVNEKVNTRFSVGETPSNPGKFPCQGIFR